jgi:hypothetical protein
VNPQGQGSVITKTQGVHLVGVRHAGHLKSQ